MNAHDLRYSETASTGGKRGPGKRPMLRAIKDTVLTDPLTGERLEFFEGTSLIVSDHPVFQSDPRARRAFESVDAVELMKEASERARTRREDEASKPYPVPATHADTLKVAQPYWRLPVSGR